MHATSDPGATAPSALGLFLLAVALVLVAAAPAHAVDMAAGKTKAGEVCLNCHGLNGISKLPDTPNLAGQPAQYLEAQLTAYRSGARQHEVMSIIAQELTDDDIANLATWYSEIKISAQAPP
jgi:cytochrome c553